ncbi:hypothetical protein BS78_03G056500 [Paspalum vaginatum]|nr:hypothetical protein BS78_03G056500 [Paspalum vaginatum]
MAKVNAKLATAAVALLLGLLLAGQEAAAVAADGKTAAPPTSSSSKAVDETAVPPGSSEAAGSGCEIPGTCDLKLDDEAAAADPKKRPGEPANKYSPGCSSINKCRG